MISKEIEIQQTKVFRSAFRKALKRPCALTMVSPYITAFKPWTSILKFAQFFITRHEKPFTLITRPPGSTNSILSLSEALNLSSMQVDLKIRTSPTLHSKIYFFEYDQGDYTAFVGSANLTRGGFEKNDETVAQFRSASHKPEIIAEITRLNGKGAFPFEYWRNQNKDSFKLGDET